VQIAIAKTERYLKSRLYTLLIILLVSIVEKAIISYALQPDTAEIIAPPPNSQVFLFVY